MINTYRTFDEREMLHLKIPLSTQKLSVLFNLGA